MVAPWESFFDVSNCRLTPTVTLDKALHVLMVYNKDSYWPVFNRQVIATPSYKKRLANKGRR